MIQDYVAAIYNSILWPLLQSQLLIWHGPWKCNISYGNNIKMHVKKIGFKIYMPSIIPMHDLST